MALKPFALILCLHVAEHHVANYTISATSRLFFLISINKEYMMYSVYSTQSKFLPVFSS
jgi:hypothetical protein